VTRRRRRPITWLVVLTAGVVVIGLLVAMAIAMGGDGREREGVTDHAADSVESLQPGDCVADVMAEERVPVPCGEPHKAEVFAVFSLPLDQWPGDEVVIAEAERGCQERLGAYEAALRDDPRLELAFVHPGEDSWPEGDREVVCLLRDPAGQRTGSLLP